MTTRILIIEDDTVSMELMMYLLRSFEFQPILAFDGKSGIEIAKMTQPDLILCDIELPDISGVSVLKALRCVDRLRTTPIIAVTSMTSAGDEDGLLAMGFDGYLPKPIEPELLSGQLSEFLHER